MQGDRLSVVLSRARLRFTGAGANPGSAIPRFLLLQLPAALYRLRWPTLAVALATVVVALLYGYWTFHDPRVIANFGTNAELKQLVNHDFTDYYSENPAASFSGQVWTNNAWLAAQCIALGIFGVFTPLVILSNAQNVGILGGVMFAYHRGDVFFLYIAPHGMLELTSIFVAAAAGMKLFWAWVAPGRRTRGQALAEDGRALFIVAIGLVGTLFVSGIIEGFVTPSPLWWPVKIAIGFVALAAFLFYMIVIGGRAARAGESGDLDETEGGSRRIVAG